MRESFRGDGMCPYCATTHRFERLAYEVFQQPARSATTSGAVSNPFPSGCGQKGHARRCEALPGGEPGCVSRLAHGLFDPQRIYEKQCERALDFNLTGHLLDLEHHEFGRFQRREPDQDVHDAEVDVVLRCGLAVALDEVGLARAAALKRALAEH